MSTWIAITIGSAVLLVWLLIRLAALVAGVMGLVVPTRDDDDLDPSDPRTRSMGFLLVLMAALTLIGVAAIVWWAG